jgi:hypothetical protein
VTATGATTTATEEDEGNGVNPTLGRSIYTGVHRIYPLRFLPPYKAPQRLYPEKFARRLRRISRETSPELRPKSEFRSLAKNITSGRPDGKSFCKPPRHIIIGLQQIILPNRSST